MRLAHQPFLPRIATVVILSVFIALNGAAANDLRIVTYNINADTESGTGQIGDPDGGTGLPAVMEALGAIHLGDGNAQPVDIFALEELHYDNPSASSTLQYLVTQLNNYYGAGTYAYDTYVDPTDGNSTGNGPSGLIYNTHTVMVLSETNLAYGTSGAPGRRCAIPCSP